MIIKVNSAQDIDDVMNLIATGISGMPEFLQIQYQMLYSNKEAFITRITQQIEHTYCAWDEKKCIGIMSIFVSPRKVADMKTEQIAYFFVDESHRDQNVAGSLLACYIDSIKEKTKVSSTVPFIQKRLICLFITKDFKIEGYIDNGSEKYDNIILGRLFKCENASNLC
jgi:hypothetical protein